MKKGLVILLVITAFVVGYNSNSGNKTTAKAETKAESQDATTNQNQDIVDLSQVSNVIVTEDGVQIEFSDGTGYWLEGYEKGGTN